MHTARLPDPGRRKNDTRGYTKKSEGLHNTNPGRSRPLRRWGITAHGKRKPPLAQEKIFPVQGTPGAVL
ncbi:hypothetical protein DWUX_513 [Desulfovibrio diazotrophicus]|nr:hypothetical protein DWUX_513 [Desulfovibrio diazotrophicus]VVU42801.1 hypothetical protein DWUX_147 [Desulfovibrio diazotrophicus]